MPTAKKQIPSPEPTEPTADDISGFPAPTEEPAGTLLVPPLEEQFAEENMGVTDLAAPHPEPHYQLTLVVTATTDYENPKRGLLGQVVPLYEVSVQEFVGCYAAGFSLSEALANAAEAAEDWWEEASA